MDSISLFGSDSISLFGSIASIISFLITLGFIFWSVIKKSKISGFNLYMLVIVFIQLISLVVCLWSGNSLTGIIIGSCLVSSIFFWLLMYIGQLFLDDMKIQDEIDASIQKRLREMDQDQQRVIELFGETIEIIQEIAIYLELKIDLTDEELNERIETVRKKIRKKKRMR